MIDEYPKVKGEFETISKLLDGYSIARFGDGELKMLQGGEYAREPANRHMAAELISALTEPSQVCLTAIPTMDLNGPKGQNWLRHKSRFMQSLVPGIQYYSAFITRPDSSPWINTPAYALLVEQLWDSKAVVVICERSGSMIKTVRIRAKKAVHIPCPSKYAYQVIDELEQAVTRHRPDVAIISAGPTATCLAARLARKGICQAIDLGSAGGFLGKLLSQVDR